MRRRNKSTTSKPDPWGAKDLIVDPAHANTLARQRKELSDWRKATDDYDVHPQAIHKRTNR